MIQIKVSGCAAGVVWRQRQRSGDRPLRQLPRCTAPLPHKFKLGQTERGGYDDGSKRPQRLSLQHSPLAHLQLGQAVDETVVRQVAQLQLAGGKVLVLHRGQESLCGNAAKEDRMLECIHVVRVQRVPVHERSPLTTGPPRRTACLAIWRSSHSLHGHREIVAFMKHTSGFHSEQ